MATGARPKVESVAVDLEVEKEKSELEKKMLELEERKMHN